MSSLAPGLYFALDEITTWMNVKAITVAFQHPCSQRNTKDHFWGGANLGWRAHSCRLHLSAFQKRGPTVGWLLNSGNWNLTLLVTVHTEACTSGESNYRGSRAHWKMGRQLNSPKCTTMSLRIGRCRRKFICQTSCPFSLSTNINQLLLLLFFMVSNPVFVTIPGKERSDFSNRDLISKIQNIKGRKGEVFTKSFYFILLRESKLFLCWNETFDKVVQLVSAGVGHCTRYESRYFEFFVCFLLLRRKGIILA